MKFTLSNVLGGAFSNLRKGFVPFVLVTLILYLVPNQLLMIGLKAGAGLNLASMQAWRRIEGRRMPPDGETGICADLDMVRPRRPDSHATRQQT